MKLAQITLPLVDNSGIDLFFQHQDLKAQLLERWGGYTEQSVHGGWTEADGSKTFDSSRLYSIAMERGDVIQLRNLVAVLAADCRQTAVMILTPCGDVEFIKPAQNLPLDEPPLAA